MLTSPGFGPAALGAALTGWERTLHIGEHLGTPRERVRTCTPAEAAAEVDWADPNVVVVVDERRASHSPGWHNQPAAPPWGWAFDEHQYVHREGMITKWEVRALAVARLRPTLGSLVWDVGAGSGSVAVECAGLHAAVIAIDSDPTACEQVEENAARHRVDVRVVHGQAPAAYPDLPQPDAVFLGGGGLSALDGAIERAPATLVASYAAIDRAVEARRRMSEAGYEVDGVQLASSRLADLPDGGVRLAATNPVFVLAGVAR